ncbi:hypothetical protein D0Z00_004378 [Geotrichum galactomycetum]|uniref:Uncharacterized protein n=1 Tax=Geotrichum galactomycetum TaxID=27317 RepID=A0ACB6UYK6_9ASCO|nr:hypothetical protein D0Z00_004378 [Geotrichum candidum]
MAIFNRGRSHSTTAPLLSDHTHQRPAYALHNAASAPNLVQEHSPAAQRIREAEYLRKHPHLLATLYSALSENSLHPPDYASLAPVMPRYAVYPRPEEGREDLPGYSPAVYRESLMCRKLELNTPYMSSGQRSWQLVYVQLNNTQLNIYGVSQASQTSVSTSTSAPRRKLSSLSGYEDIAAVTLSRENPHSLPGTLLGPLRVDSLLRSYTLQYAEAGVATDYSKRPNVMRVRAEGEQFLLENTSQEDLIAWTNTLQTGIDVALPVEERALPRCRMIPRRRRRSDRNRTTTRDNIAATNNSAQSAPSYLSRLVQRLRSRRDEAKNRTTSAPATPLVPVSRAGSSPALHTIGGGGASDFDAASDRASISADENEHDAPNDLANETPEEEEDEIYAAAEESDDADDVADLIDHYTDDSASSSSLEDDDDYLSAEEKVWEPERTEQSRKSFLKYAYRCLYPLPATSTWVDKKVVHRGHKYIVTKDALQRINETPLVY